MIDILRTPPKLHGLYSDNSELADDVRALATLVHALRGALILMGVVKGGA